jgi:NAD(P)H-flavin reductase
VPKNQISQAYATTLAICREIAYPQGFYITKMGFSWLTPPPLGRSLVLVAYWITIVIMLTSNAIIGDAYYFERIGFRAAWVCVMQVPLIILLSCKVSIIGFLMGSSYERVNWLHRWVSRTLFLCVTFHGSFFLAEWVRADFVAVEMEMMPMVQFGMGAWGVMLWQNITGLSPFRHMAYEIFLLQHMISAAFVIWLIFIHVPSYAQFYVWIAIGFVAFDWLARGLLLLYRNINLFRTRGVISSIADRIGYRAELQVLPGNTTGITIKNVTFRWSPGQHIYVRIPRVGFFEAHPFTISNTCSKGDSPFSTAQLAIRTHSGFTRRLHKFASNTTPGRPVEVRAFVQGPFGSHPSWNTFETVVLISASTGCSFTIPILEHILENPCCVRQITFLLLVREKPQCACYIQRLRIAASRGADAGVLLRMQIVVTGKDQGSDGYDSEVASQCLCGPDTSIESRCCGSSHKPMVEDKEDSHGNAHLEKDVDAVSCCQTSNTNEVFNAKPDPAMKIRPTSARSLSSTQSRSSSTKTDIEFSMGRPDLAEYIRRPVETARGETCVAICGGKALTGFVRNAVTKLSDERAVHKGTGAQGICLHVEEFGL